MNGVQHDYYYVDGVLMYEKVGTEYEMFYRYDTDGRLSMVTCRDMTTGQKYYYNVVTNAQGDVVNLLGGSGAVRVTYTYDAYGRLVSMTDTSGDIQIGSKNSIRYRGYVYDSETELYYLQSRYYDPETGRFINCDAPDYLGVSDTFTSWNGFAYCENDPVNKIDPSGYFVVTPANVIGAVIGGIVGAVGGYFLTRWLADKLQLTGWKRNVFIGGLTAIITASAVVIGYFIGPYVSKASNRVFNSLKSLIKTSCCFVKGTPINTPDGYIPIEDIRVGDIVYSQNSITGEYGEKRVSNIFSKETDTLYHIMLDYEEIITTTEHPFWCEDKGWIAAKDLTIGDILIDNSGKKVIVNDVFEEKLSEDVVVYNFEVEDWHAYFVGYSGVLVHNKCSFTKIGDSYLKRKGFDAHSIKYEVLGKRTNIKLYDLVYDKSTGAIFVLRKGAKAASAIATGYFIK